MKPYDSFDNCQMIRAMVDATIVRNSSTSQTWGTRKSAGGQTVTWLKMTPKRKGAHDSSTTRRRMIAGRGATSVANSHDPLPLFPCATKAVSGFRQRRHYSLAPPALACRTNSHEDGRANLQDFGPSVERAAPPPEMGALVGLPVAARLSLGPRRIGSSALVFQ